MDDIKDARKDQMVRILGNRTLRVQPFGANASAERAYQRAERISAAIYLATNHISSREPALEDVRQGSLDLLSAILVLREGMRNPESFASRDAHALLRKLISCIRLLAVAGHMSVQNADTLVEALDELGNFLTASQRTSLSEGVSFDKADFFELDHVPLSRSLSDRKVRTTHQRLSIKDKESLPQGNVSNKRGADALQRSERIARILGDQGQLGIKDIVASLPEYSEKMIQRELKALVEGGRVKKAGAKRWSLYSLVQ